MSESGRGWVLEIWQEENEHVLSTPRRKEFLGSDLVGELSQLPRGAVREGAAVAMGLNVDGHLLLTEWLREVLTLREKTRTGLNAPQVRLGPGDHRWQETWDAWNKPGAQH